MLWWRRDCQFFKGRITRQAWWNSYFAAFLDWIYWTPSNPNLFVSMNLEILLHFLHLLDFFSCDWNSRTLEQVQGNWSYHWGAKTFAENEQSSKERNERNPGHGEQNQGNEYELPLHSTHIFSIVFLYENQLHVSLSEIHASQSLIHWTVKPSEWRSFRNWSVQISINNKVDRIQIFDFLVRRHDVMRQMRLMHCKWMPIAQMIVTVR